MGKSTREQFKILVVGLPPGSTSADLQKLVKPIGNPLQANMAVDADGRERGFGFVQFADAATQQAAIAALDKTALSGRTLNVRAVEDRAPGSTTSKPGSGVRGGRPCYDFGRGKCARGAACKWAHIAPPIEGDTSRRPDWQKKRPMAGTTAGASGGAEALLENIPEDYCRKYQFGSCHRGEACRWKHVIWKGAGAKSAAASATPGSAAPAAGASSVKRAKHAAGGAAAAGGANASMPIGGMGLQSAEMLAEELHERLRERETAWRRAHPEHSGEIPTEVKRRDVVWRALERKLARTAGDGLE